MCLTLSCRSILQKPLIFYWYYDLMRSSGQMNFRLFVLCVMVCSLFCFVMTIITFIFISWLDFYKYCFHWLFVFETPLIFEFGFFSRIKSKIKFEHTIYKTNGQILWMMSLLDIIGQTRIYHSLFHIFQKSYVSWYFQNVYVSSYFQSIVLWIKT